METIIAIFDHTYRSMEIKTTVSKKNLPSFLNQLLVLHHSNLVSCPEDFDGYDMVTYMVNNPKDTPLYTISVQIQEEQP